MDYKDTNLDSYNKNASIFSQYYLDMLDLDERPEAGKFISLLKGKELLDLGCGAGYHALWFKEHDMQVTALDFSEALLKMCKEKGLRTILMDIENLHLEPNSFDGIWAVNSLLHVPKDKIGSVLDRLSLALRKDGILYVTLKEGEGEFFLEDKHNSQTRRFFSFWNEKGLLEIFGKNFQFIELGKRNRGTTNYLCAFFRNNKLT